MDRSERFAIVRRVVVFGLGAWVIADALTDDVSSIPKLVIGMIMVGVLPIENFALWRPVPPKQELIDRACKHVVESKPEATANEFPQPSTGTQPDES